MKELYIAPEVKLIGFVASEKMAAEENPAVKNLSFSDLTDLTLTNRTSVATTDIRIPLT